MFVGGSGSRQIFNKASVNTKVSKLGNDVKNRQVSYKPNDNEIKSEKNESTPLQQVEKKLKTIWNLFSIDLNNSFNFTKSPEALRDKHVQELTEKVKELKNELKKTRSEKDSVITGKDLEIVKLTGDNKMLRSDIEMVASIKTKYGSSSTTKTGQILSSTIKVARLGSEAVVGEAFLYVAAFVALLVSTSLDLGNVKEMKEQITDKVSGKVSDIDLEAHQEKLNSYLKVINDGIEKLHTKNDKIGQLEILMAEYPKDKDLQGKRVELHNVRKNVERHINTLSKKHEKAIDECQKEKIQYKNSFTKNSEKAEKLNAEYKISVKNEMEKLVLPMNKAAFSIIDIMKKNNWTDYNTFSKQLKSEDQKEIKKMFEELDEIMPSAENLEKSEKLMQQLQVKIEAVRPNSTKEDENVGILRSIGSIFGFSN